MRATSYTKRVVSEVLVPLGQTRPFKVGSNRSRGVERNEECGAGAASR
jgi:hypothetical protein